MECSGVAGLGRDKNREGGRDRARARARYDRDRDRDRDIDRKSKNKKKAANPGRDTWRVGTFSEGTCDHIDHHSLTHSPSLTHTSHTYAFKPSWDLGPETRCMTHVLMHRTWFDSKALKYLHVVANALTFSYDALSLMVEGHRLCAG